MRDDDMVVLAGVIFGAWLVKYNFDKILNVINRIRRGVRVNVDVQLGTTVPRAFYY